MPRLSRLALVSAALASTASPTLAKEDEVTNLETITVTASSEPVDLSRTGATVNVLTAEEIEKAGDKSVATLLARLPGLSMTRNGGLGTSTALRIRGLSGPYIGVRIDGIDVADPSGTQCQYDFGATTAGGISRIEVLRGSQSALYGSEAIGGVVDITTFRASKEGSEAQVELETGAHGTTSGTASVGLKTARGELAFSASRIVTDGISAAAAGTETDGFRATTLSFYGSYALTDTVTVGLNGIARDSFSEFDSPPADTAETEDGKLRGLRAFVKAETGAVRHELSYAHTETERLYPLGWTKLFTGTRDQIGYKGNWDAGGAVSLNWGLDRTEEDFTNDAVGGASSTNSVFGEALYAPTETLDLSFALRNDTHSSFGGKTTGRAAMAWRPTNAWVIRAVAGTGFRAPSLYELHGPYGNSNLQPETSRSYELGAEYLFGAGGSVQATLFDTEIKDKIQWAGGAYNQVPGTTQSRGVELTARTPLTTGWDLYGTYTYTDAYAVSGTGAETPALRVPRNDLVIGLEGQITDRLSTSIEAEHVTDVWDTNSWPLPASKLPDYTVANLSVSYDLTESTSAYLRVENVFDETYQTVRDYGQPGRSVYVGVRAKF